MLDNEILKYIEDHREEAIALLVELAQIPAPSNAEEKRAAFCKEWLEKCGAEGVYVDEALNVIYPVGCEKEKPLAVFMAHSDVVFPDTDPLPLKVEDGWIHCPGVGDDTGNVVALMMAAKYVAENRLQSRDWGILLVINSGEEGLGNLKGSRRIFSEFGSRVKEFVTFDLSYRRLYDRSVGSRRFLVELSTQGGHSWNDFGRKNAIACLADVIHDLYRIPVPQGKGKTTFNVGTVSGGTSVNTIAQQVQMLYEFRSEDRACLDTMQEKFDAILNAHRKDGVEILCTKVGDRPCSGEVDPVAQAALADRAEAAAVKYVGLTPVRGAASTDCNVPLSLGIPSVCIGCLDGVGEHTREEKVKIDSVVPGLKICFDLVLHHFDGKSVH